MGRARDLALVAFVSALVGCFAEAHREAPGPCSRLQGGAAADCGVCHAQAYAQWSRTAHASTWTNPRFRAEFDPAPSLSCVDCHADAEVRAEHPEEGVSCSSCHLPTMADASVDTGDWPPGVQMCVRCHQFDFPAPAPG